MNTARRVTNQQGGAIWREGAAGYASLELSDILDQGIFRSSIHVPVFDHAIRRPSIQVISAGTPQRHGHSRVALLAAHRRIAILVIPISYW